MSSGGVARSSMTAFRAVDRGFKSRPEHSFFKSAFPGFIKVVLILASSPP